MPRASYDRVETTHLAISSGSDGPTDGPVTVCGLHDSEMPDNDAITSDSSKVTCAKCLETVTTQQ